MYIMLPFIIYSFVNITSLLSPIKSRDARTSLEGYCKVAPAQFTACFTTADSIDSDHITSQLANVNVLISMQIYSCDGNTFKHVCDGWERWELEVGGSQRNTKLKAM